MCLPFPLVRAGGEWDARIGLFDTSASSWTKLSKIYRGNERFSSLELSRKARIELEAQLIFLFPSDLLRAFFFVVSPGDACFFF